MVFALGLFIFFQGGRGDLYSKVDMMLLHGLTIWTLNKYFHQLKTYPKLVSQFQVLKNITFPNFTVFDTLFNVL